MGDDDCGDDGMDDGVDGGVVVVESCSIEDGEIEESESFVTVTRFSWREATAAVAFAFSSLTHVSAAATATFLRSLPL